LDTYLQMSNKKITYHIVFCKT